MVPNKKGLGDSSEIRKFFEYLLSDGREHEILKSAARTPVSGLLHDPDGIGLEIIVSLRDGEGK